MFMLKITVEKAFGSGAVRPNSVGRRAWPARRLLAKHLDLPAGHTRSQ
jgi:hypothetical protein